MAFPEGFCQTSEAGEAFHQQKPQQRRNAEIIPVLWGLWPIFHKED
jgi:hypothetical protein